MLGPKITQNIERIQKKTQTNCLGVGDLVISFTQGLSWSSVTAATWCQ